MLFAQVSLAHPKTSALTGDIQIVGRQLLIKGTPFVMKAVCYSPVPKGGKYPEDLIFLHPTAENLAFIEKDFQMMHAAGVNTIRTYVPIVNKAVLDLLTKYDLKTIVPIYNSIDGPIENIPTILKKIKDQPSTLILEIGNEWNYNYFYSKRDTAITETESHIEGVPLLTDPENDKSDLSPLKTPEGIGLQGSADRLNIVRHFIRGYDTIHPISTVIGDIPYANAPLWSILATIDSNGVDAPSDGIDLYGTNVYEGLSFGNRFDRWKQISNKPLYIAECGADAFNSILDREDGSSQAVAVRALITEMQENLSAKNPHNVLVGGAIFEWNDEWWKADSTHPDIQSHQGMAISNGNGIISNHAGEVTIWTDAPNNTIPVDFFKGIQGGPYGDGVFNEDWFGILDIDRNPRPAYKVLKELYTK